jgi:hypothetical protein
MHLSACRAFAVALVTLLVAGCGTASSDAPGTGRATNQPTETPTVTPTDQPTAEPPAEGERGPGLVFYVGERARTGELRLFARPAPASSDGGPLAAVRAATAVEPDDPDLRTLWGGDAVSSIGFDGIGDDGEFSVRLADDSATTALPGMTPREAELAVQQVVWTLQSTGTKAPVAFYVGGSSRPLASVLGVPATGPRGTYVAEDPADVLNHVAVLEPAEGAAVEGKVVLTGVAESFEGTVGIRAVDSSGTRVHDYSTTAEQCCGRLWPWRYVLDTTGWEPGTYVVEARTDDPVGIAAGSDGPEVDTRTIVVG